MRGHWPAYCARDSLSPRRGAATAGSPRLLQHARQVGLGDQHLAGLGALVARDHAAPLHHVDQPPGARVAHAQAPLEHRGGGGAHLHHGGDRVAEQVVLVGVEVAVGRPRPTPRLDRLEQLLLELRLALAAPVLGQLLDLLLGDERALDARRARLARRAGTACRPARAATRRRSGRGSRASRSARTPRRRSAPGTFALIMPVITSALGRWVASTRWMPTARDFCASRMIESSTSAGRDHHQVGELVDHAQDVRQRRARPGGTRSLFSSTRLRVLALAHHAVALLHLLDQVAEHVRGQPRARSRPA